MPLAQLTDVEGSRPCAAGRCLTTAIWLCESYGAACAGLAPEPRPEAGDAASIDAPTGPVCKDCEGDGCGCELGAGDREPPIGLAVLLAAAVVALARRRRATARGRCP